MPQAGLWSLSEEENDLGAALTNPRAPKTRKYASNGGLSEQPHLVKPDRVCVLPRWASFGRAALPLEKE